MPSTRAVPGIVQEAMDRFAKLTGRRYSLFWYSGAPDAERVLVQMGSGVGASREAVDKLVAAGEKVGLVTVRLYRPFDAQAFVAALPKTVRSIAVLDRTKEPGAIGEPLYQDVVTALVEAWPQDATMPRVIGGRYGLSSKEFTPAMAKAALDELQAPQPKRHFTVGIVDDVTQLSLKWDDGLRHRGRGRHARGVLWPGRRRHGRRDQEHGQDHRREHAAARPGLFRLRQQEVGCDHRVAPALRAEADRVDLPDRARPTSSPATSSSSWRSSTCWRWPARARPSC